MSPPTARPAGEEPAPGPISELSPPAAAAPSLPRCGKRRPERASRGLAAPFGRWQVSRPSYGVHNIYDRMYGEIDVYKRVLRLTS